METIITIPTRGPIEIPSPGLHVKPPFLNSNLNGYAACDLCGAPITARRRKTDPSRY